MGYIVIDYTTYLKDTDYWNKLSQEKQLPLHLCQASEFHIDIQLSE